MLWYSGNKIYFIDFNRSTQKLVKLVKVTVKISQASKNNDEFHILIYWDLFIKLVEQRLAAHEKRACFFLGCENKT